MARDYSNIQKLVEEKKKNQFQIPNANTLEAAADKKVIERYESIPNYNVLERTFDSNKKQQYDLKQKLVNAYTQAQNRETQRFIQNNNISDSMLENAFGVNSGKGVGTMGFAPPQSEQSKKDTEYLSSLPGVNMEQLRNYYGNSVQQKATEAQKEYAAAHPILGTAATIGTKNVGGLLGALEGAGAYLSGQPISTDSGSLGKLKDLNEVRQVASDTLQSKADTELGKKATEMMYGVGTSIADMGMGALLTPTSPLISLGSNAVADTMINTADRGLSPDQIMGTSAVAGGAEVFFEKISLDGLKNILRNGASREAGKNLLKTLFGQMAREAGEEMGTEAVNTIADRIINQDLSNYVQAIEAYQKLGMSEDMAKKQAWADIGNNIIYSGIAGALSGGLLGGSSLALNGMMNRGNVKVSDNAEETETNESLPVEPHGNEIQQEDSGIIREADFQRDLIEFMAQRLREEQSRQQTQVNNPFQQAMVDLAAQRTTESQMGQQGAASEAQVTPDMIERVRQMRNPTNETQTVSELQNLDPLNALGLQNRQANENSHSTGLDANSPQALRPERSVEKATTNSVIDSANNSNSESHTPEQLRVMEEYRNASEQEIIDFANKARDESVQYVRPIILTEMNDFIADYVMEQTGIDTHGNNIILNRDSIRHIDSEHINNKNGKSTITDEDLARIKWVLDNADEAVMSNQVSNATRTKDGKPAPHLFVRKRIDGHYYVVEAVSDGKKKNNIVISAFIEEAGNEYGDVAKIFKEPYRVSNASSILDLSTNVQDAHELSSSNVSVPNSAENVNSTNGNQRVRSYNTTLIEKTDAPQELKNEFIENPDMYTQLSNTETLARAVSVLENNDINAAINEYHRMLVQKDPAAVPLGYNISKQLAKDGKLDESVQIVREMSKALTESGQFSQAAAITMLNNDPEAAKRYLVREIDTMNTKGREKFGKKWKNFELTEEELLRFNGIQQGDTEAISQLYNDVYNRLRREYPSTMTEKLMEFRRISMLLNVRTNMRNITSNFLMTPVRWTADRVSALGEGVWGLFNPDYVRTQSINPIRSKQSKDLAKEAFKTVEAELLGKSKYEDIKDATRDKQVFKGTAFSRVFDTITGGALTKANQAMGKDVDPSLLETARNFTYFLLKKGDDVFVRKNFESRMASYLQAQGITDLENIPADAYVLASQEAMKATFKDDSALAKGLSEFRQMLNKAPGGVLGDIVMPFTKTPANLAMRGIDYSPLGVYNGVKTLRTAQNQTDVAKGITQLGQAATGSAAILLGMALAEAGWITGALSDDKDEAQFQQQQGQLAYSVKTPAGYFSYDWAQPAAIPLILGATIYDSQNNGTDLASGLFKGFLATADAWLELSPLQNLSDIFGGYGTPAENVADVLLNDFPLSFIPSQLGALAKTTDTTQRVSYDNGNAWDSFLNQAKAKIPGMSDDLPVAYDTWGNPIQRQDSTWEAFAANFLNPGQFGNENVTPIDDEISALYDATGNASVFPKKAAWSYTVDGESIKLDNEQYSEFQRIMGSNAYDMAEALIESDYYKTLSDEQKAETIKNMYSFADALAKSEVLGYDVENSDTYKKTYSVYSEKGAEGAALYTSIKEILDGSSNAAKVSAVNKFNISDEDKGYYLTKMINLSGEAQAIFDSEGYAGVYRHYYQKAMTDKIKEMRSQSSAQGSTQVTPEMIAAVAAMRAK